MVAAGTLIWISVRPLLRLALCVGAGVAITKADIFPPVAARGAGQMLLNVALPCLLFSKMVPAFSVDNISVLGPLVLITFIYLGMGILAAWMIKQVFWVPHRFRYGILVAGGWGNYGDIPTSVVMSLTGAAPFNGTEDQTLAVAYIAALMFVYMVTLFPCGGHKLIAKDFEGPEVEPEEVREAVRQRRLFLVHGWVPWIRNRLTGKHGETANHEAIKGKQEADSSDAESPVAEKETSSVPHRSPMPHGKHVSFYQASEDGTTVHNPVSCAPSPAPSVYASRFTSPTPTVAAEDAFWTPPESHAKVAQHPVLPINESFKSPTQESGRDSPPSSPSRSRKVFDAVKTFLTSLMTPPSLTIIVSFIIALIPSLKALFVDVPGTYMPNAPDGQPPLSFLIETASFVGAAAVPLGLICLGSALARLKLPGWSKEEWMTLPLGAMAMLAVMKMLVFPVFGVLITKGLIKAGVIPEDDKVLQFVCIFFSCLPTATTQVFITQVYSGTGSADDVPAFLVPQYLLMFISMTALTAYTIQLIF